MKKTNPFAPPEAPVEMPRSANPPWSNGLVVAIFLHSLAMLSYAPMVFTLVGTGSLSMPVGLAMVLAWALLLTGGVRLLMGARRTRYPFAFSALFGLVWLVKLPLLVPLLGLALAVIALLASVYGARTPARSGAS